MRILIISDAWLPQVNGVVRSLDELSNELNRVGHETSFITPDLFRNFPCPSYPEIRLAPAGSKKVGRIIESHQPTSIHIATEGPLGLAARRYCLRNNRPFTTSFHTRFPEYVNARWHVPVSWGYAFLRWFHGPSRCVMSATVTLDSILSSYRFPKIGRWSRGVDTVLFRPREEAFLDFPRPIALYVGRVAVEKNIEAFLQMEFEGSKVVVGDGPQLAPLSAKYPRIVFVGAKTGEELARYYAAGDVFVFPSKTDTFGLVQLEALASGIPVAAYPVPGPIDVITSPEVGVLDDDLAAATRLALTLSPEKCRTFAEGFSWAACAQQFLNNLVEAECAT